MCTSTLRLENRDASQLVAFKIKTTAVKRYVVRPNVGILLPGKFVEVAVLLNYDRARLEGVDLATVHDRFQVLSVAVDVASAEQLAELWARTPDEALAKTMVKCKFVDPELVKTISPVVSSPGTPQLQPGLLSSPEPDMMQAKSIFKQEMANSKAKQEAKTMRAERDAALASLKEKEEELQKTRAELEKLRKEGVGGGGGGENSSGVVKVKKGMFGKVAEALWFLMLYVLVVAVFFVVCYKVFDYDPIRTFSEEYSMRTFERRIKLAIYAFSKA